jgi:hypothetical protein
MDIKQRLLQDENTLAAPFQYATVSKIKNLVFNCFQIECVISTFDCERDEWMVSVKEGQKISKKRMNEVRWYVSGILDTLRSL